MCINKIRLKIFALALVGRQANEKMRNMQKIKTMSLTIESLTVRQKKKTNRASASEPECPQPAGGQMLKNGEIKWSFCKE